MGKKIQFDITGVAYDCARIEDAARLISIGYASKQAAISILSTALGAIQRRIAELEGRKSEPIGIGPGGYDPTKDPDITGV